MAIDEGNQTGPVTWVLTEEELGWLAEAILGASSCVVDLETTGLDEYAWEGGPKNGGVGARIVLASFTLPQAKYGAFGQREWDGETPTTWVLPLSHPDSVWRGVWRRILRQLFMPAITARIPMENQNIKFDARWLKATCGVDISDLITWDTKDAWHLLDENRSTKLKVRGPQEFGIEAWNDFALDYPGAAEKVPLLDLGAYAARDTWWTWMASLKQKREMFLVDVEEAPFDADDRQHAKLGKFATWVAMPTVASLTKVEQRGMRLDVDWTQQSLKEDLAAASAAMDELADYAELPRESASTAANAKWFLAMTEKAIANDDLRVLAVTDKGNPSWDRHSLARQERAGSKVAAMILKQRYHQKRAEFLTSWLSYVNPDGIVHASFNSGSVLTGRLSSSEPNLQQVNKKLRPAWIPREGYVIADFDYSQIELRVAAFVSRCMPMIEAFRNGADLHRLFAAEINHLPSEEITAEQRQRAKAGNFGLLYEMSAYGFKSYAEDSYGVQLTEAEAIEIHSAFFRMWSGMKEWHESMKLAAHRDGYVTSPLGRVRRLPNIWDGNDKMVGFAERQAINSPVQSMASDLLQMSMASMQGLLPSVVNLPRIDGVFPIATVHDSIVAELEEDRWEQVAQNVAERMQSLNSVLERFGVDFDVPLLADYSVGTRWSLSDVSDPDSAIAA